MLVKIEARILIFPGTDFHFPSTSVPPGTFLGSEGSSAPTDVLDDIVEGTFNGREGAWKGGKQRKGERVGGKKFTQRNNEKSAPMV